MMQKISGGLAAFTALVHIAVGTMDVMLPTLRSDLPPDVVGTLHACWHFVSVFLLASAFVFWRGGEAAKAFGWLWLAFAGVFVVAALWQSGVSGLMVLPQWVLLGPTGALALWASRRGA
ncbi:hypothetical protein [Pseudoprimorskyibacter insulae]|uniref:Uncharacterized protein n=1 Tax=Pseudoprimorskyibacter insulae TaxID=1695997 RepID=A0A2R8AZ17_9RHOB|nr:hypothetical protein [Pseudoprimorskyibacter insulae]SPF81094.1 hypothetical protein PRI8871_02911 [Pseudoprimorskyibacter insulae]